jgi:flavin-dependent dehydrogenase
MATLGSANATVIGAGPAGALAAALLAKRGVGVALLDKASFPRHKVCGCCLSPTAISALRAAGLDGLVERLGAVPLREMHLYNGSQRVVLEITDSFAVSRARFDNALVQAAVAAGAAFVPEVSATVRGCESYRRILDIDGIEASSKVVIAADGLAGTSLRGLRQFKPQIVADSKVGVGAVCSPRACDFYEPNVIYMFVGNGGYVGLVRLEDNSLDVAAALSSRVLRGCATPAEAVATMLRNARCPVPSDLFEVEWRGTVALSRRREHIAGERIFVVGDSASYVEPFTGEGIAWALLGALNVVPLAERGSLVWNPMLEEEWERTYYNQIRLRQRKTALVANILKNDVLRTMGAEVLARVPMLSSFLVESIHA